MSNFCWDEDFSGSKQPFGGTIPNKLIEDLKSKLGEIVSVTDKGADGDGTTNDAAAFSVIYAGSDKHVVLPPGTYRIGTSGTLGANTSAGTVFEFMPGAQISIDSGVTLSLGKVRGIIADPRQQIFTGSGTVSGADATLFTAPVSPCWFPGADLGAKMNAAFTAGFQMIDIPATHYTDMVISTTVLPVDYAVIRHSGQTYGRARIKCATAAGYPVFDCAGLINVRFEGLNLYSDNTSTPTCIFHLGRLASQAQSDHITFDKCTFLGYVKECVIYNRAAEVLEFNECYFRVDGAGDAGSPTLKRCVMLVDERAAMGTAITPRDTMMDDTTVINRSCTSFTIRGGQWKYPNEDTGCVIAAYGAVQNFLYEPSYSNSKGVSHIYVKTDNTYRANDWHLRPRVCEWNGRSATDNVFFLVDAASSAPITNVYLRGGQYRADSAITTSQTTHGIIKAINSGRIIGLFVEPISSNLGRLVHHQVAALQVVDIVTNGMEINASGQILGNGMIRAVGLTLGSVVASTTPKLLIYQITADTNNMVLDFGTGTAQVIPKLPLLAGVAPATANLIGGMFHLYTSGGNLYLRAYDGSSWKQLQFI